MTGGEWAAILTAILVGSSGWITAVLSGRVAVTKSELDKRDKEFDRLDKNYNALKDMIQIVKGENDRLIVKSRDQERRIKELEDLGEQQAAQIEYLQRELDERDGTLVQVKTWAEMLVKQLRDAYIDPVPMPDKERTRPIPKGAT